MDYNYILEKLYKKTEFFIIKKFKEFKADDRTFIYSIDQIRISISNYNFRGIIGSNSSLFESCHRYYNHHTANYEKGTPISKTIDKEVKEEFIRVTKEKKPFDKNYKEIDNYHFNLFVHDLIKYDFLRKVENQLSGNSELYKLYFDNNDYTEFTLEKFDDHVINSELYRRLYSKFYPNKSLPMAVKKVNEWGNTVYDIFIDNIKVDNLLNYDNSTVKSQDIKLEKTSEKKIDSNWSVEEKSFLFYILCNVLSNKENNKNNNTFNLPNTELLRLVSIIDFYDEKSFTDSYRDSIHYKILSKNIDYFDKDERMIFLERLISKLENYKLKKTANYTKDIRNKTHNLLIKNNKTALK